jgi:hypothetical protein
MSDSSLWSRVGNWTRRSAWTEWGTFLLAVMLAAALLIAFAITSPIFRGPRPLPASDPSPNNQSSFGLDQGSADRPEDAPPDDQPPPEETQPQDEQPPPP